jgi:predicted MFS family arabinose efflux permease
MTSITAPRAHMIDDSDRVPAWGAVYALSLCTFTLIASEFMPISLLSPIAHTLRLTEGQAGQAISISGIFAVLTSLSVSSLIGGLDRRHVLLGLTTLLIISGTLVAFAPSYLVLMIGRAFVGVAIGGFWSMSAATVMRLVPEESVPKGLAILNGGATIATTVAAPLGSFMGAMIGWRGAFFCVVPVAIVAVLWQAFALPSMPAISGKKGGSMIALLRRPAVLVGLVAVAFFFMGQFALYTYLRPFLEQVTHVGIGMLSTILLVIGVAAFIGNAVVGRVVQRSLTGALVAAPAIMAVIAVLLTLFGTSVGVTTCLLALWGLVTSAAVAWWTWVTRAAPDDAEAGGGLMVAIIQLAITLGATIGGIVFDAMGAVPEFLGSAVILVMATVLATVAGTMLTRHLAGLPPEV